MMSALGAVTPWVLASTELDDMAPLLADLRAADRGGSLPAAFKEIRGCS